MAPRNMLRLFVLMMGLLIVGSAARAEPITLVLDAEFGNKTSTSAQAIERGIRIAMNEVNAKGGVLGRPLELRTMDNRGVPAIGVDNFRDAAADRNVLGVFGGKFSPTYIEVVPVANEVQTLLLDPWGSADAITDLKVTPSWVFRLSLKDSWAGPAFIAEAQKSGHKQIGVITPNTAWGRSNVAALEKAASTAGVTIVGTEWYHWGEKTMINFVDRLVGRGAQTIVLIANEAEGAILARELAASRGRAVPILAHWGITGGAFEQMVGDALYTIDLKVIQTYSFYGPSNPVKTRVLEALKKTYGLDSIPAIESPVGVAHAYDLTHAIARAIEQAGSADRNAVRDALEKLPPWQGLVRSYDPAFTPTNHDALRPDNVFFARFVKDKGIVPVGFEP
ncbi:MAG: ABC transporter substrate-binding protein [Beijerinckiaceae bacterium]|nr:ABC transporter substrate-binding protein [Beijerinckiaceae bacterium]